MDWKFFLLYVIIMPTVMFLFFIVALVAPQLGLANGTGLLWGAVGSLFVALPVSWFISKKIF